MTLTNGSLFLNFIYNLFYSQESKFIFCAERKKTMEAIAIPPKTVTSKRPGLLEFVKVRERGLDRKYEA